MGRHYFELWWDKYSESCSSRITDLHSSPSSISSFLARYTYRVTGQDYADAANVVLCSFWIPCYWEAAQGSCGRSHVPWQPCLKIWACSPKVSKSYHWTQLQFPLPLLLSCEFQEDFLNWSQSLMLSATGFRKESFLRISIFATTMSHVSVLFKTIISGLCPPWSSNRATTMSCSGHDRDATTKFRWRTRRGITLYVFWMMRLFGSHNKRILWRKIEKIGLLCQSKKSFVRNTSAPVLGHNLSFINENIEETLPDSSLFRSRLPCIFLWTIS